jgi:hypothetical protein
MSTHSILLNNSLIKILEVEVLAGLNYLLQRTPIALTNSSKCIFNGIQMRDTPNDVTVPLRV